MNERDFLYWLQGMLEYTDVSKLDTQEMKSKLQGIKNHLKLVFKAEADKTPVKDEKKPEVNFAELMKKAKETGPKPVPYTPSPGWPRGYDPNYWLTNPKFGDITPRPDGGPILYC